MKGLTIACLLARAAVVDADPPQVPFGEAIQRAIAHNPTRRIAEIEIERVRALLDQATAALLPQIGGTAAYTRLEANRYVQGHLYEAANSEEAALGLSTPLVDLHALAARRRASDQVAVTAAQSESVKRDVAITTAHAYFAAFTAVRLIEVARDARDNARAHVDFTRQRFESGIGTELDYVRARSDLATAESQIASAITSRVNAEAALGVICGNDGPLAADGEPTLADTSRDDITQRADIMASRRARDAATEALHLDWTLWVPSLALAGQGFFTHPVIAPTPEFGYQLVFSLTVPIFDGGLRHGEREFDRALMLEAREQTVGQERQAHSEIEAGRVAVARARDARDAARTAAELAVKALELAALGYRAGTATELDVLDAQRTARDARAQATIADDELRHAQLDLLAATGAFP
jgi:outer membrane protein